MKLISNRNALERYIRDNDFAAIFDHDVSSIVKLLYYEPEEYLISYGTVSEYLLFLVKGECRFFTIAGNGSFIPFGTADSFQVFGEVSSLWNKPPKVSVQAVQPTYCLGIDLIENRDILLNDCSFLRYICSLLSQRVVFSNESLTDFMTLRAQNRLAIYILRNSSNDLFTSSLTTCSDAIGISYRHLLRLLDSFCKQKILRKEKRKYYILNRDRLRDLTS